MLLLSVCTIPQNPNRKKVITVVIRTAKHLSKVITVVIRTAKHLSKVITVVIRAAKHLSKDFSAKPYI